MHKPWIVGLTGGIGSGKTAVASCFAELGIHTVDADDAARWVVEPGEPALVAIAQHFGPSVIQPDGQLDRAALRAIIFQQPEQRQWLEQLLHPIIRQRIVDNLATATSPYAILVSPLLIETQQTQLCQRVLVIDVPEALQISRTMQRDGVPEAQVRAILQAQFSRLQRLEQADDVLVNDQDLTHIRQQVQQLHQQYLALSSGETA